ncbi:MAG: hypothetical protein ACHQ1D_00130 [Nitrososphaerales archaeon]
MEEEVEGCSLEQMRLAIRKVEGKIDRVLSYLENDPTTGREGIFQTVAKHGISINEIILKRDIEAAYKNGKSTVYGFIGGAVGSLIVIIIDHLGAIIKFFSRT